MEKTIMNMPLRRILFLISLPQLPEFEQYKEDVNECLQELRALHVDVREHIKCDDLADASNYDIVIVLAHRDDNSTDTLLLADGTMTTTDFVNSIPTDFKGIIDFSSCHSVFASQAIKKRCPACKVQVALMEIPLLRRLILYPALVDLLNSDPNIEYGIAYDEISKELNEVIDEVVEDGSDVEMTHLGQKMSSIYAPTEVMRGVPFQIIVFFHYNSEKKIIKMKATQWQNNAVVRDECEIPINLNDGDEVNVNLSFFSPDAELIKIVNGNNSRSITIKKEVVTERFVVEVSPDFSKSGFLADIEIKKGDTCFVRCPFNINIGEKENKASTEILIEKSVNMEDPYDFLNYYSSILSIRLFGNNGRDTIHKYISSKKNDAEKLLEVRKYLYNNRFFLKRIKETLNKLENNLSDIQSKSEIDKRSDLATELLPAIRKYTWGQKDKVARIEGKINNIKSTTFNEIELCKASFEWDFIECMSEIDNLGNQIDMLKSLLEIKTAIESKKNDKERIRTLVTQFLMHPHKDGTDKELYDLFKSGGTGSIISSSSKGQATLAFSALVIAMACGEYISIDNGKENWILNVTDYINLDEYNGSLRPPKIRINKTVSILGRSNIQDIIKKYSRTVAGRISVTAFYLQKVKIRI